MRVLYFVALRLLFICMLDSNPRVSSNSDNCNNSFLFSNFISFE